MYTFEILNLNGLVIIVVSSQQETIAVEPVQFVFTGPT